MRALRGRGGDNGKWGPQGKVDTNIDGECHCGDCPPCRRAMRELDKLMEVKPVIEPVVHVKASAKVPKVVRSSIDPREAEKERRRRKKAERIMKDGHWFHPDPNLKHGTHFAYNNCGCGCDACRAVGRAKKTKRPT